MTFIESKSTVKPQSIEITKSTVYLRKNITESVEDEVTWYTYEECAVPIKEFNANANAYLFAMQFETSNEVTSVSEKQDTANNNQLSALEGIADLYDVIATLGE